MILGIQEFLISWNAMRTLEGCSFIIVVVVVVVWIGRGGQSKELTPKKIFTNEVWKPQLHWENVSPAKSIPN